MDWAHVRFGLSLRLRLVLALLAEFIYMTGSRWAKAASGPDFTAAEALRTPMRLVAGIAIWVLAADIIRSRSRNGRPLRDVALYLGLIVALGAPILIENFDGSVQDRWILALACIPVGFHEEIAFRGVLQTVLVRRFGWLGFALTLVAFVLFHYGVLVTSVFNVAQIILASTILGLIYHRTGSLLTVMIFHALYDAMESVPRFFHAPDRLWGLALLIPAALIVGWWYRRSVTVAPGAPP